MFICFRLVRFGAQLNMAAEKTQSIGEKQARFQTCTYSMVKFSNIQKLKIDREVRALEFVNIRLRTE